MDKKLAKQFVRKVSPLEHSEDPRDRKAARTAESKLRRVIRTIPNLRRRRAARQKAMGPRRLRA